MSGKISEKTKKLLLHRVLPAGIALAACTVGAYAVNSAQYRDRFLPGTEINSIDVSDKTLEEAADMISASEEDYDLTIRFRFGEKEVLKPGDVGLAYNCTEELQSILDEQNRFAWISRQFGKPEAVTLKTCLSYNEDMLASSLAALPELQPENMIQPADANLMFYNNTSFRLIPEIDGSSIKPDVLAEEAGEAIESHNSLLDLTKETDVYEKPAVRADDPQLTERMDSLNDLLDTDIEVEMSDGTVRTLDSNVTKDWITVNPEGLYTVDKEAVEQKCRDYIADVAKADDTYGEFLAFASTNYGMQRFESDYLHGHELDQEAMSDTLISMVESGRNGKLEPVYSHFEDNKDPHLGGTYVEVDVYAQRLYYYEDNELYYECNCVTGTEGYRSTPSGIFCIEEMERGRYLNGYTSSGELAYSSWVNFWMCFLPHYGLHDASWRDEFGGDIYLYDGSHGCVNLPYSAASTLYERLDYGTPVVILRGETYEDEKPAGEKTEEEGDDIHEEIEEHA